MKLVVYIMKKFLPVFLGALCFFSIILNVVDLLMNLWKYIQMEVTANTVLKIMQLYVPKTVWYAIPLAILFAASYCLSELYANNELLAIFASGISLFRFTLPMLVFSIFMSFGLFFFEDKIVVPTFAEKTLIQNNVLGITEVSDNSNVAVISEGGNLIYYAREYNENQKRIYNLYIVFRNEEKELKSIVFANSAEWNDEESLWKLNGPVQYDYRDGTLVKVKISKELEERINEPSETFRKDNVSIENVNVEDSKIYIEHLKRAGLPYSEELSQYYKKFAFPCIVFLVVFLSIGLTGKTKKNVLLISLASSICAAVLFYVSQMVTMLMAQYGYISAFTGAWFPVILFTVISIVLLKFART